MAIAAVPTTAGAALDNSGTEFWLGFPTNYFGSSTKTLFITGEVATTGKVEIPGLAFTQDFTVTPGAVTSVAVPDGAQMPGGTGTQNNGMHVTAADEVVVYGLNRQLFTTDAYLGLPVDALGTSHTVLGWGPGGGGSEFSVVAPRDGTTLTITPSVAAAGPHPAGTSFDVSLDQGQQYQLKAAGGNDDLTGTKVVSNQPVAVFGGHNCGNVPSQGFAFCDHMVEQNPAESTWGTSFLTVPLKQRQNGDTFVFVASQDGTEVSVNGAPVATLNAGQRHQQIIEGQSQIQSSKPILIAQFSNGTTYDGVVSDPFEMHVPPFEQFQTSYTVTTPASGFGANFINLIAPEGAVGSIELDGTPVPASEFTPIGSSGFSGAQVDVALGSHRLTGNGQPFGVFVYGFDRDDSYGYPGGAALAPVATLRSIAVSPAAANHVAGTRQCATATLTDSTGGRVPGVRVDFTVTGANPSSGSVVADGNGEAQYCYTGDNRGQDTIRAVSGSIAGDATKTWGDAPLPPAVTPSGGPAGTPEVVIAGHRNVALRRGRILLRMRCHGNPGQRCAGSLRLVPTQLRSRLQAAGTGKANFDLAAGTRQWVKVKPPAALKAIIKKRRKAIARVTATLTGQTGKPHERLLTIQREVLKKPTKAVDKR